MISKIINKKIFSSYVKGCLSQINDDECVYRIYRVLKDYKDYRLDLGVSEF